MYIYSYKNTLLLLDSDIITTVCNFSLWIGLRRKPSAACDSCASGTQACDDCTADMWEWTDNSTKPADGYSNWADDDTYKKKTQDCANTGSDGKWRGQFCNYLGGAVCKNGNFRVNSFTVV